MDYFKTWRVEFFGKGRGRGEREEREGGPKNWTLQVLKEYIPGPHMDKKIALYLHYFQPTAFGYFKFVAHRNGFALERPCACLELDLAVPMYRRRCGNVNVTRPNVFDCTSTSVRVASIACRRVCFAFFVLMMCFNCFRRRRAHDLIVFVVFTRN